MLTQPAAGPTRTPSVSVLAIDIGGTKLEAGVVDLEGAIVARERVGTPQTADPEGLFGTLAGLVSRVCAVAEAAGVQVTRCGVGTAGPMTWGGETVSPLNIPAWRGFPLRTRLAAVAGCDVVVENDAKALALGEGWLGAARGEPNYLAMVVSTGVGGGIVLDGRLLDGRAGNAGHIGHIMVEPEGRQCACGSWGCLEAEVSGLTIEAITGRPAAEAPDELRVRCGTLVGRAVASVAVLCDLPLAVVCGSVALGYGDVFFAAAQREIDARCGLEFARGTRILPGGLGADGPLLGAAAVGIRALESSMAGS